MVETLPDFLLESGAFVNRYMQSWFTNRLFRDKDMGQPAF